MFAEMLGTRKIPILMVEDVDGDAALALKQLSAIDDEFDITHVSTLGEAIDQIGTKPCEAVVLDLGLPDAHDQQAIFRLRHWFPALPIVVLSGKDDPASIRLALKCDAQEFLSKRETNGARLRQAIMAAIIRKSLVTT